jgi:hypothetical protein
LNTCGEAALYKMAEQQLPDDVHTARPDSLPTLSANAGQPFYL